jgi:hypothetical protein
VPTYAGQYLPLFLTANRAQQHPQGAAGLPFITSIAGSGTGSYFADQFGQPIMLRSFAIWMLFSHAGRWSGTPQSTIDTAIGNLKTMGANAVMVKTFSHTTFGSTDDTGNTYDGITPFVSGNIAVLNNTFWTRFDYLLNAAAAAGITVLINAAHATSDFASGGILNGKTSTQWGNYGTALGNRYKGFPNIIWMMGGDYFDDIPTELTAFVNGIRGAGDTHLVSVEAFSETTSRRDISNNAAQTTGINVAQFNFGYSYNASYDVIEHAFAEASPIPCAWMDGYYDQNMGTSSRKLLRDDAWWSMSSGGRGYQYGSEGTWQWDSGAAANLPGYEFPSLDQKGIWDAFASLPGWHKLIPDTDSSFVTAGRGTHVTTFTSGGSGGAYNTGSTQNTYVTAGVTADGTLAVVYLPVTATVTINPAELVGSYTVAWMDPVTGVKTPISIAGTYTSSGTNSRGGADKVLVFQAA